jgi:hypothetical protein
MNVQEARRIVAGCENEESPVRPECFVYASSMYAWFCVHP